MLFDNKINRIDLNIYYVYRRVVSICIKSVLLFIVLILEGKYLR